MCWICGGHWWWMVCLNDPPTFAALSAGGRLISRFLPMTRWSWSGFWIVDSGAPKSFGRFFLAHFPKIPRWWKNKKRKLFERKDTRVEFETFSFFELSFVFSFQKHVSLKWRMFFVVAISSLALNRILVKKLGKDWWHVGLSIGGFKPWSHSTWPGISETEKNTGERLVKEQDGETNIRQFGSR